MDYYRCVTSTHLRNSESPPRWKRLPRETENLQGDLSHPQHCLMGRYLVRSLSPRLQPPLTPRTHIRCTTRPAVRAANHVARIMCALPLSAVVSRQCASVWPAPLAVYKQLWGANLQPKNPKHGDRVRPGKFQLGQSASRTDDAPRPSSTSTASWPTTTSLGSSSRRAWS